MMSPPPPYGRGIALAVVICAFILSFFHRFAPASIVQDLAAAFEINAASLGILASTYFYVYTVMQIPTGILADTLGPRRILFAGGLVAGAGSAIFGLAPDLTTALIGRTLAGLGVSVVFIAMLKLIAIWFQERHFATLVGVAMLLGNFGSMLAGTPLAQAAQVTSWRYIFIFTAVLSVILGIACWFLIPEKNRTTGSDTPPPSMRYREVFAGLVGVIKNRDSWPGFLTNLGICGSFFAFAGLWATPYLMQVHQLNRITAANHMSLYFAGFALGSFVIGTLSDRLGKRKPVLMLTSITYSLIWLILLSGVRMPVSISYLLFTLMGLSTATFTLTWAYAKEVNRPEFSGVSTGVTNMGGFLAAALLQPIVGLVMDWQWDGTVVNGVRIYSLDTFRYGLSLLAITGLVGTLSVFFMRETYCRSVWQR